MDLIPTAQLLSNFGEFVAEALLTPACTTSCHSWVRWLNAAADPRGALRRQCSTRVLSGLSGIFALTRGGVHSERV